jgi:hypothetical protein
MKKPPGGAALADRRKFRLGVIFHAGSRQMSDFADNLANGVDDQHGLFRDQVKRQPHDKAASLPNLDIATIHGLLHLLDSLLIVSAVDIFDAPKMIGATDDVSAIQGHSTFMCQPLEGWRRALSVC